MESAASGASVPGGWLGWGQQLGGRLRVTMAAIRVTPRPENTPARPPPTSTVGGWSQEIFPVGFLCELPNTTTSATTPTRARACPVHVSKENTRTDSSLLPIAPRYSEVRAVSCLKPTTLHGSIYRDRKNKIGALKIVAGLGHFEFLVTSDHAGFSLVSCGHCSHRRNMTEKTRHHGLWEFTRGVVSFRFPLCLLPQIFPLFPFLGALAEVHCAVPSNGTTAENKKSFLDHRPLLGYRLHRPTLGSFHPPQRGPRGLGTTFGIRAATKTPSAILQRLTFPPSHV